VRPASAAPPPPAAPPLPPALDPPADVVDVLVMPVVELAPADPPAVDVLLPASTFTHRPDKHVRPLSQAPPAVHAHPSAPNAQSVAVVEDEQATQRKLMAIAVKPARKTYFPCIASSFLKRVASRRSTLVAPRRFNVSGGRQGR
jgi:hypothetical protein